MSTAFVLLTLLGTFAKAADTNPRRNPDAPTAEGNFENQVSLRLRGVAKATAKAGLCQVIAADIGVDDATWRDSAVKWTGVTVQDGVTTVRYTVKSVVGETPEAYNVAIRRRIQESHDDFEFWFDHLNDNGETVNEKVMRLHEADPSGETYRKQGYGDGWFLDGGWMYVAGGAGALILIAVIACCCCCCKKKY